MDSQAIREERSDNHDLQAWVNPITKERHYFVTFPVVNGRMPRMVEIEMQRADTVYVAEVKWLPEQPPAPNLIVTMNEKGGESDTSPKFKGQPGNLGDHLRWLLTWFIWTVMEVQARLVHGR